MAIRIIRIPPRKAAQFIREYRTRLVVEVIVAESETIRDAIREAELLSAGTNSLVDLARAGHPYSRRAPQPDAYPPGIINRQTGKFNSSWQITPPSLNSETITTKLYNTDPKSVYLQGTSKMVRRDIASMIYRNILPRRLERLQIAQQRAATI